MNDFKMNDFLVYNQKQQNKQDCLLDSATNRATTNKTKKQRQVQQVRQHNNYYSHQHRKIDYLENKGTSTHLSRSLTYILLDCCIVSSHPVCCSRAVELKIVIRDQDSFQSF